MAKAPQLHFARFEFKYLLSNDCKTEFEKELSHFVAFDPFVAQVPQRQYFVRSLYYDDEDFSTFYDKVDGLKKRAKFRVRTYTETDDLAAPQFLEIKGRHNQLVYKHRTPISVDTTEDPTQHLLADPGEDKVKQQFFFEYYKKRIRPVALIDYWRRPYISKWDPEFRLTFDSQLQATHTSCLKPKPSDRTRQILPGYTVMELKFKRHNPAWFHRLLQAYELERVSISKICYGLEALELVEDI